MITKLFRYKQHKTNVACQETVPNRLHLFYDIISFSKKSIYISCIGATVPDVPLYHVSDD